MAWTPIAAFVPQWVDSNGDPYSGAVLKAYQEGTSTNTNLATDNTGGTTATDIVLNASGYPAVGGSIVVPHIDQVVKLALYATQAAADADTGAIWSIDSIGGDLALLGNTGTATYGDALVGVKRTETGAVALTVHSWIQYREVNAGDFGVTTSETAANNLSYLNTLINTISTGGGGVVNVGPGTFNKSAAITMKNYVRLKGRGQQVTVWQNTTANVDGVDLGGSSGDGYGGIENMKFVANSGDTTSLGLDFDTTNGWKHGLFKNIIVEDFNKGVSGGDELWECRLVNIRAENCLANGFYFVGSTGAGSDNVLEKCYSNNVGQSGATGKGFEISACMRKSIMLNCTIGDTSSTDTQLEIGTNVFGLQVIGGNCEGFTLANGKAAIDVQSASVVSIHGMSFQSINGPGSGSASLIKAQGTSVVNVQSCVQFAAGTGTLYSLELSGAGATIYHHANSFADSINTTYSSGAQIAYTGGKKIARTSVAIDLSGAAVTLPIVYLPGTNGYLASAEVFYSEATSSDAGITLELGYSGDTDFLGTLTTAISQSQWATEAMTINDRRIGAGFTGPIIITSPGGKTGTGECYVVIEYTILE